MNADQEFLENSKDKTEDITSLVGDAGPSASDVPPREDSDGKSRPQTGEWSSFQQAFEHLENPEEKVRCAIQFMKETLSHPGAPRFRDFWEARKLCLPLFKEAITVKMRAALWQEYVDLSVEARRLKEILDEQSLFAFEQIELAIQSLVKDLDQYELLLEQIPDLAFPVDSPTLAARRKEYNQVQRELHLLNTLAAKMNALRKEVIKTEMRIRNKNKLFDQLSVCGDKVFPRRKELIRRISEMFLEDVASFVQKHFEGKQMLYASLREVREEIKAIQNMAKELTLNTHAFTETRLKLSECWDQVKILEKERKKEIAQKKQEQKQLFDAVREKIQGYAEFCKEQTALDVVEKRFVELMQEFQSQGVDRYELKSLREELAQYKKPLEEKERALRIEAEEKEKTLENARLIRVQELRLQLQALLQEPVLDVLLARKQELEQEYHAIVATKAEKLILDRQFKQLKDRIHEVKRQKVFNLSQSDNEQLLELRNLLSERKERRQEIKNQLESYRKVLGGSGFDFEKAMTYRELIESEKTSLEKLNLSIEELENKIEEIEG